ncbi:hypothetical protein JANAI62_07720 [Jannaschia pagri]|uniref:N-acetyltransferase domain-containing protein n=1 Tax=Jannaschia pagri TaxID=2829797 RepID=A0ABQ4NIB3_9RHOB|nr:MULTISPECIES: GNAT family N-acetyltransferase [unclassified Jannaschia]GIT89743.1 hypothetical protein JANAI61_02010 [Jannaschia sp. AI_61]GIT94149.1 hypothetical protein JANAI62_07720 [Jannaschia sp. AI_62]
MIRATEADLPAIQAMLSARAPHAMFPQSNLRNQGLGGGHPHGMTVWIDTLHTVSAMLGLNNCGMVMPVWDDMPRGAADVLKRFPLKGFAGPTPMVRPLTTALALDTAPATLDADEPQFLLHLPTTRWSDDAGTLAPVSDHRETAIGWRTAYQTELHMTDDGPESAVAAVDRWCAADSHRLLIVEGQPVAMTGFNARLPDIVQVGGVYTPPDLRRRGFARQAVALHLAEARAQGVREATLFAATDAAVACYQSLGFDRIGDFALVLFDGEVTP